ncbi:MAG: outer membrane beta-barrel protein [Pseudomonadota bacterium]
MKYFAALAVVAATAAPALAGGPVIVAEEPMVMQAPAPVMATGGDWGGFYAGAQLGFADVSGSGLGEDGDGMVGGLHAGYRMDFGQFVAGAELDYDLAKIELDNGAGEIDSMAHAKLMGGFDLGQMLVYGTVGKARASGEIGGNSVADTGNFAGLGLDYAVSDQMVVGGEVLKHQFDDFDNTGVDYDATTVRAKVSFRF